MYDLVSTDLGRALTLKGREGFRPVAIRRNPLTKKGKPIAGCYEVGLSGNYETGVMIGACANGTFDCYVRVSGSESEFIANGSIDVVAGEAVDMLKSRMAA